MTNFNKYLSKKIIPIILIAIILLQASPYLLTRFLGQDISMVAELYDPHDLFRGDYVHIQFEQEDISNRAYIIEGKDKNDVHFSEEAQKAIYSSQSPPQPNVNPFPVITISNNYLTDEPQNSIYATLEQFDDIYKITALSFNRPSSGIYIKTNVFYYPNYDSEENLNNLDFGLHRVYIPEHTGSLWEDADADENTILIADMKVFRGNAIVTKLRPKYIQERDLKK